MTATVKRTPRIVMPDSGGRRRAPRAGRAVRTAVIAADARGAVDIVPKKLPAKDIKMNDGDHWVTLSNGRRVLLDKDGNVRAGFKAFVGMHISKLTTQNGKPLERRTEQAEIPQEQELPNARKYVNKTAEIIRKTRTRANGVSHTVRSSRYTAAKEYFREHLQDRFVKTTINGHEGQVHFTSKTWSEFYKDPQNFERKVALLPHLPEILREYGNKAKNEAPFHEHKDFNRFKRIDARIPAPDGSGRRWKVTLFVGAVNGSRDDFVLYHFTVKA